MRALAIALVGLTACNPLVFDDLEDEAAARVLEVPDDYPGIEYGAVITAWEGTIAGEPVSSLAVSAGIDSAFRVYRAWEGGNVDLGGARIDGCEDDTECAPGAGAALAGIPVWRAGTADEGRMCLLVGAPTESKFVIRCEAGPHSGGEIFSGPVGSALGASAAGLSPGNPLGIALAGAPGADGGRGAVFRIDSGGGTAQLTSAEVEAALAGVSGLGATIAATTLSDGTTAIAAGASTGRIVVVIASDVGGAFDVSVRACIDGVAGGGQALAWGDVTGDGEPELFVGSSGTVRMHAGPVPDPGGCADWPSVEVPCPEGLRDGIVGCAGSAYGAALATGDVDGDGTDDLIVGAPDATVDGVTGAGAVFVLAGGGGVPGTGADVLTHSRPELDDRLGASVAAVPTHLDGARRAEPAAGAPGREAAVVFLCSGLPGDTPQIGTRCIAR